MHLFLICIFFPYTRICCRAVILRISHFYHFEGQKANRRDRQNEVSESDIFMAETKLAQNVQGWYPEALGGNQGHIWLAEARRDFRKCPQMPSRCPRSGHNGRSYVLNFVFLQTFTKPTCEATIVKLTL